MVAGSQPGTRQRWNSNWRHGFGKAVAQLREERERGRDQGGRLGFANLPATRWFCSGAEEEVVVAGRGGAPAETTGELVPVAVRIRSWGLVGQLLSSVVSCDH